MSKEMGRGGERGKGDDDEEKRCGSEMVQKKWGEKWCHHEPVLV